MNTVVTVEQVRKYWDSHPLFSHELDQVGSPAFFDRLDAIKREDVERFSLAYWDFGAYRRKQVLDVGSGPGWITVMYAQQGAEVTAVDLTPAAVSLTKAFLAYRGLSATVQEANAEALPFEDASFDLVVSSGVLHHTPDYQKAIAECYRVLRPDGEAKITLYRKGVLHHRLAWPLTARLMRLAGVRHPGADLAQTAADVNDFIRQYDGEGNPFGLGMTNKQWAKVLREVGFQVVEHENHFFPRRFLPFSKWIPAWVHQILERCFGTMVYFRLKKA
ncbi:MAG: class I SAM-dependent methyltransferase [Deltaproteobacteria bacterium]|nr:class I SAM-dependent methyltransferase [Deltaproteobacteria bacterium]